MITFPTNIFAAMRYKVGFFFQERAFSSSVSATNPTPTLLFGLRPTETVVVANPLTYSFTKALDETVQLTESIFLLFNGGISANDTVAVSDSGLLRIQDYCDFSYFQADYVGVSSAF